MKFRVTTEVARPAPAVFEKLSDCRNEAAWNTQVSEAELVSGEPVTLGTAFRTINRGKEYGATITVHESPSRVVFDVKGKPMDLTASYELRATNVGTAIEGSWT